MSVNIQEDLGDDWDMAMDMAAAMPEAGDNTEPDAPRAKYSNLNEALVEAGSAIGDLQNSLPIAFRFTWHQMPVFCRIGAQDGIISLTLETDLGPLPYTVENKARRSYLRQLNDPKLALPIGQYTINERRRFRHCVEQPLVEPITGSSIVTAVVQSLLAARPYYELAKAS